mgnify:CR=1 FL=1|tara:strand:- start:1087 stop:1863 length:777 start_codon:yes stop_codon:yes gene_type:complete
MKETKVGKKPHGVVLVVSLGKPGDKKPERAADPDKQKKMKRASFDVEPPASSSPADVEAFRERALQKLKEMREQGLIHPTESNPAGLPPPTLSQERMGTSLTPAFLSKATPAELMEEEDLYANIFADQDMTRRAFDNLEAFNALRKGEPVDFCTCCSPSDLAWAIAKAKKKSKPFHGYNPKRHHKKGGLNAAGRAKFKRETGANLKPPVTTKPSKLKPGSKKAKRRKSFCARMSGMKGPTSKKGKLTPKGAALKRWNC